MLNNCTSNFNLTPIAYLHILDLIEIFNYFILNVTSKDPQGSIISRNANINNYLSYAKWRLKIPFHLNALSRFASVLLKGLIPSDKKKYFHSYSEPHFAPFLNRTRLILCMQVAFVLFSSGCLLISSLFRCSLKLIFRNIYVHVLMITL